jgi:nucleosome assembly protein 1-like 1
LNEEELKTVGKLEELQEKIDEINFNYEQELEKLNEKYAKIRQPELSTLQDFVNGKKEGFSKIPSFWMHVLMNSGLFSHPEAGIEITERDEDALKFLMNVTLEEEKSEKVQNYKINFHFEKNPYFPNEVLSKSYSRVYFNNYEAFKKNETEIIENPTKEEDVPKPQGTKIEWKEGKNLQFVSVTKTLKGNKKSNKTEKKINKVEPCESFFNFFDNSDDEMANDLFWEILNEMKNEILQDPFYYYMEEAGEEYDEDEDDDEEEEEEPVKVSRKK